MNPPRERQHHSDRRVRHFFGAMVRHICHWDTSRGSEGDIEVIGAYSAANDEFAIRETFVSWSALSLIPEIGHPRPVKGDSYWQAARIAP